MVKQIQYRGGTAEENNAYTGPEREITVDTTSHTLRVHDGIHPGGAPIFPVGMFMPFVGGYEPLGWLVANGALAEVEKYPELAKWCGTRFGTSDDPKYFVLPNATNRVFWGASQTGYLDPELPNVQGQFRCAAGVYQAITNNISHPFYPTDGWSGSFAGGGGTTNAAGIIHMNLALSNPIYKDGGTVRPPALGVQICVKY